MITMLPPRDQTAVGVNVTLMAQDDPTPTAAPVQLFVCEKSPVAITLLMVKLAVPVLLIVMVAGALLDPTRIPVKLRPAGVNVAIGATPTPLIATVCGLPEALSVNLTVDDRLPVLVGLKITLIVQLAFTPSEEGQLLVCEKSAVLLLEILMVVKDSDASPVFVSVTTCGVLPIPTCWFPKLRLVGDKLTTGCADRITGNANQARKDAHLNVVGIVNGLHTADLRAGDYSVTLVTQPLCSHARCESQRKIVKESRILLVTTMQIPA